MQQQRVFRRLRGGGITRNSLLTVVDDERGAAAAAAAQQKRRAAVRAKGDDSDATPVQAGSDDGCVIARCMCACAPVMHPRRNVPARAATIIRRHEPPPLAGCLFCARASSVSIAMHALRMLLTRARRRRRCAQRRGGERRPRCRVVVSRHRL
jgi:hypothetical protein